MKTKNFQQFIFFILSIIILAITDYYKLYLLTIVALVLLTLINKFIINIYRDSSFKKMVEKYSIYLFIASLALFYILRVYFESNRLYSSVFMGIALAIVSFRAGTKI